MTCMENALGEDCIASSSVRRFIMEIKVVGLASLQSHYIPP